MRTISDGRSGMRMTAHERRQAVLSAAVIEFAHTGYAGTSTDQIARRAGISQPYLFRLFKTKKALFIAAVTLGFDRVWETFLAAAGELEGDDALAAMGAAYLEYLQNTDLLLLQLQAYAAAGDPEIRTEVAALYERLADSIVERTGITELEMGRFFSIGMLLNVAAALGLERFQGFCVDLAESS